MSQNSIPTLLAPEVAGVQPDDTILWLHAAFCEMALPLRAAKGTWQRDIGPASLRIEPGSAELAVPSGRMPRLIMMHICDAAVRANNVELELGENAATLAERMGLGGKAARDLVDQLHRMLSAKISVTLPTGPEITVFDARSRTRGDAAEWRSSIRLGSRFLSSLANHAIALDRRIVRELSDSPAALDAYAWIRLSLHGEAAGRISTTTWQDLLRRFGTPSQNVATFRTAFEDSLRMVFDADHSIALAVDDEGVSVRLAAPEEEEAVAVSIPEEAPRVDALVQAEPALDAPSPEAVSVVIAPPAQPAPPAVPAASAPAANNPADKITQDSICLPRHLTGLPQGIWLRRGHGADNALVGVTPGTRFEPDRLTVLAVEPMIVQVSGGLYQQDFERVSAWVMANRDLIDEFWEDRIDSYEEVSRRVRKAPAPGWR
ncbi:MAG: hypothetical protein JWR10_2379 [Rubritepida sp.]|nr:hypothetical protein [Rubritepida sp.]